jgi:type 1 fimbriae regulatory protein FimB
MKYLESHEQKALERAIKKGKSVRDLAMFKLMLHHGLRCQELLHIKLNDLEHRQTRLHVHRVKNGENHSEQLSPEDTKLLRSWLKKRREYPDHHVSPYLFISRRSANGMMTHGGVEWLFRGYCREAGIAKEKAHPHTLRHTCAVNLLQAGATVYDVKESLGHRSESSSFEYLKLSNPDRDQRLSALREKAFPV